MSEMPEFLDQEPVFDDGSEMGAVETWTAAFTKPSEETFARIAAQPGGTTGKALLWVFLASLVSSFVAMLAQSWGFGRQLDGFRRMLPPEVLRELPMNMPSSIGFGTLICGVPVMAVFTVIFFALGVALIQFSAKLFGGVGSFEKQVYTFSAISVPSAVVTSVLSLLGAIPFVGLLTILANFGLSIYVFVLNVLAVKAVNKLDTGKAIGALLLPGIALFLFFVCCMVLFLLLLGPAIGEVFSEMQRSMPY